MPLVKNLRKIFSVQRAKIPNRIKDLLKQIWKEQSHRKVRNGQFFFFFKKVSKWIVNILKYGQPQITGKEK